MFSALGDAHRRQLLDLFDGEWWSRGRSWDDVQAMLASTHVIVGAVDTEHDQLVGFARALTDGVFIAVLLDVIVARDRRGQRVGRMVVNAVLDRLKGVNSVELVCQPELEPFYAQFVFTAQ